MRYAIPRQTDDRLNSTNGFTIGKRYPIRDDNGRVATVYNDNGHERCIGLDEGNSAHLQYQSDKPWPYVSCECAGYFEIVLIEEVTQ